MDFHINPEETSNSLTPQPIIVVRDLILKYGSKTAFQGINMQIERGEITTLIGPSGCGKSSFLLCLNRLIDLVPTAKISGEVLIDGKDIFKNQTNLTLLRRQVGMIFQKPNPFPTSIKKNLELPLREHYANSKGENLELIEKTLQGVGLWDEVKDRLNSSALLLSGGQQQRLCIARALVLNPSVLLMDEPCSSLDPLSSATVEELVQDLRGKCSVVVVTHNLAQARRIADRTALFWFKDQAGQLIEYGRAPQIFEHPQQAITSAYIKGERG